jgi:hypothetical protein
MKPTPAAIRNLVVQTIVNEPTKTYLSIAKEFGLSVWHVSQIAVKANARRPRGRKKPQAVR